MGLNDFERSGAHDLGDGFSHDLFWGEPQKFRIGAVHENITHFTTAPNEHYRTNVHDKPKFRFPCAHGVLGPRITVRRPTPRTVKAFGEFTGHPLRWQDKINAARRDGAARHSGVSGSLGILREG